MKFLKYHFFSPGTLREKWASINRRASHQTCSRWAPAGGLNLPGALVFGRRRITTKFPCNALVFFYFLGPVLIAYWLGSMYTCSPNCPFGEPAGGCSLSAGQVPFLSPVWLRNQGEDRKKKLIFTPCGKGRERRKLFTSRVRWFHAYDPEFITDIKKWKPIVFPPDQSWFGPARFTQYILRSTSLPGELRISHLNSSPHLWARLGEILFSFIHSTNSIEHLLWAKHCARRGNIAVKKTRWSLAELLVHSWLDRCLVFRSCRQGPFKLMFWTVLPARDGDLWISRKFHP